MKPQTCRFAEAALALALTAAALAGVSTARAQSARPTTIPCALAVDILGKTYARLQELPSRMAAYQQRFYFWDVYDHASSCPEIQNWALNLRNAGYARDSGPPQVPPAVPVSPIPKDLSTLCGGRPCNIVVTPGGGATRGHENPFPRYIFRRDGQQLPPTVVEGLKLDEFKFDPLKDYKAGPRQEKAPRP
ncbi:MAG: hypothetical protein ING40_06565 [Burkholderiales bacterium]|nr:hypothetical protein [Burkholderiales bacterium]